MDNAYQGDAEHDISRTTPADTDLIEKAPAAYGQRRFPLLELRRLRESAGLSLIAAIRSRPGRRSALTSKTGQAITARLIVRRPKASSGLRHQRRHLATYAERRHLRPPRCLVSRFRRESVLG